MIAESLTEPATQQPADPGPTQPPGPVAQLVRDAARHRVVLPPGPIEQIIRFAAIGVLSTLAYVVIYAILRSDLPAAAANAVALVVTAVGNTAANRRLTFGVRGGHGVLRHHAAGLLAFGLALAITTASIGLLHLVAPAASRPVEIAVLVVANAIATALRFLVLRRSIAGAALPATSSARG